MSASKKVTPTIKPAVKSRRKVAPVAPKKVNRGRLPESIWLELRDMYEGPTPYTQKQLSDYARAKGYKISQPRICAKIGEEGWIRGAKIEELYAQAQRDVADRFGAPIKDMLDKHVRHALMVQSNAARILAIGMNKMRDDPLYQMPINTLRTISSTMKEAHEMEARAMGWDYRIGRPFVHENPDEEPGEVEAPRMIIAEMTANEVEEVRRQADIAFTGGEPDDDMAEEAGSEPA